MQGKVLLVDPVPTNRIALKVKLASEHYNVEAIDSTREAVARALSCRPDLILLGMPTSAEDTLDLCRRIKSEKPLQSAPIVILSSENCADFRLQALSVGADDIFHRSVDARMLLARLRSLLRASSSANELKLREGTSRALGFAEDQVGFAQPSRIALISTQDARSQDLVKRIRPHMRASSISNHTTRHALGAFKDHAVPDVIVIALDGPEPDVGLRLLAEIRARSTTRHAAIVALTCPDRMSDGVNALDLGANDAISLDCGAEELALRLTTQFRYKRVADRLRDNLRDGLQAAVTDPLTGLYNRRYALSHLERLCEHSAATGKEYTVMVADIDHFKQINDRYGHAAGDIVLVEVAKCLRQNLRAVDLVARIGGEEFLVAMPDTGPIAARIAAKRFCREIAGLSVAVPIRNSEASVQVDVTVSIGAAIGANTKETEYGRANSADQTSTGLLELADQALYAAKHKGRNCVQLTTSAASGS